MSIPAYNDDQRDALQEVLNIAMGQAGDSLARILDHFVKLSIPRINLVSVDNLLQKVSELLNMRVQVSAVRQAFYNGLRGEAIVIFPQLGCDEIYDLMGYEKEEINSIAEQEMLLEISNLLVGAVLNGVSDTLSMNLGFSAPSLMAIDQPLDQVLRKEHLTWSHALLLEVNFTLENRDFKSHLLLFMTEQTITELGDVLDQFLEDC